MLEPVEESIPPSSSSTATRLGFPRRDLRVAWVALSLARGWRYQAVFREFSRVFPNTVIFTAIWPGFSRGFEGTFTIRKLGGMRVWNVGRTEGGSAPSLTWVSPLALWQLIRFRPEVILTNGFHTCTLYALLLKAVLRTRVILIWQGVSGETGGNAGSLRLAYRRWVARYLDLAVTYTQDGYLYLERLVGAPVHKLLYLTGEVADEKTLRRGCHAGKTFPPLGRPVFLFVGSPTRSKGIDKLLEAYSRLLRRDSGSASLVIVGDGPECQDLRQLARDLRIEKRVLWEGFVPYDELGLYYSNCDVFVLPSLEDTWGVAVQEAMVFGKPVLCSRRAGVREMVVHGANGFIFDPHDPEELADYMSLFIREPQLLEKFGAASSELSKPHTPETAAHRLACAVAKALGS